MDSHILHAWLSARSIARELPAPVAEHGGFRIDTNSETEIVRWVFPRMDAALIELARSIDQPRHFLKLCGSGEEFRLALPDSWQLHEPSYFMRAEGEQIDRPMPTGYTVETIRNGDVVEVRITSGNGELAASGYAAETQEAFIYDRIITSPAHRRRGLGHSVMAALHRTKRRPGIQELLVATEDGRALYSTLGWRTISPYSTASIVEI